MEQKSNDKQRISAAKKCQGNARYAWKRTAKEKTCEDQSGIREEMEKLCDAAKEHSVAMESFSQAWELIGKEEISIGKV